MSRRSLAACVALGVLAQLATVPTFAATFGDAATSPYRTAIQHLQQQGIVEGYSDGTFKPLNSINRAEFLKIVLESRQAVSETSESQAYEGSNCFTDVQNQWFAKYVCSAKQAGIVSGYPDGTFKPEQQVNFVEASKILALAYEQPVELNSPDWYEPYARALESSQAIPTTVSTLDSPLKRGEMSEMIWRLSEDRRDLPSTAYLNLKYQDLGIDLSGDEPQTARSCEDIRAFAHEANRPFTDFYGRGGLDGMPMPAMAEAGVTAAPMAKSGARERSAGNAQGDYAKTNVQVEGVDEADIVKTDGTYVYLVRNVARSTVEIVQVKPATSVKQIATIALSADASADMAQPSAAPGQMMAQELYLDDGKLIVIGTASQSYPYPMPLLRESAKMAMPGMWPGYGWTPKTMVKIFDVRTPSTPKLERTLSFDGSSISSRRIGGKLYLITQASVWRYGAIPIDQDADAVSKATAAELLPGIEDSAKISTGPAVRCADVVILPRIPSPDYITVSVIPTDSPVGRIQSEVILGSAQNVYASLESLYLAATEYQFNWHARHAAPTEKTNIFRFAFTDDGVTFKSQGSVPGHILNQFAMDEMDETFRIATTTREVWQPSGNFLPSQNNLYVLNRDSLETVGSITGIAPGETIYSVRFMGKRAYMVTFKTVDPLFVIDLSSPRNPRILGQLKIPGFSDYLHPYDENHLIGFGKEVDESIDKDKVHSENAVYYTAIQGMKVSIFDVTDVERPIERHKIVIGDRNTTSPLLQNHKALLFEKDRSLLAFPILVTKADSIAPKPGEWTPDPSPIFQGAHVYDVDVKKGFTLRGTITHYDDPSVFLKSGGYWYNSGRDIERITRVGDSLVTISQAAVRTHTERTLQSQGQVELK